MQKNEGTSYLSSINHASSSQELSCYRALHHREINWKTRYLGLKLPLESFGCRMLCSFLIWEFSLSLSLSLHLPLVPSVSVLWEAFLRWSWSNDRPHGAATRGTESRAPSQLPWRCPWRYILLGFIERAVKALFGAFTESGYWPKPEDGFAARVIHTAGPEDQLKFNRDLWHCWELSRRRYEARNVDLPRCGPENFTKYSETFHFQMKFPKRTKRRRKFCSNESKVPRSRGPKKIGKIFVEPVHIQRTFS